VGETANFINSDVELSIKGVIDSLQFQTFLIKNYYKNEKIAKFSEF